MLDKNQHKATKACQVQLHTILLTIGLFIIGLDTFIDMWSRGLNPLSKLLFKPNTGNAEAPMLILALKLKNLPGLPATKQTNDWNKGLIVID